MFAPPLPSSSPEMIHGKYVAGMFASGEQGAWYDPSDMSTLFQDAAGTTPVTAVEQPVGLMLDKSRGLVLGPELVTNGDFSAGATEWNAVRSTLSASSGALAVTGTDTYPGAWQAIPTVAGRLYRATFEITSMGTATTVLFAPKNGVGDGGLQALALINFTTTGVKTAYFFATSAISTFYVLAQQNAVVNFSIDNISVRELPGNHASQTTTASRPTLKQDEAGRYYLSFDGVDDWLITPSINFNSTSKMTVFAGVRKLSDAAAGAIVEQSATPASADAYARFSVTASSGNLNSYGLNMTSNSGASGSRQVRSFTYTAPISNVLTNKLDSSFFNGSARAEQFVNGLAPGSVTVAFEQPGSVPVNFGNYPLYIGRRGGTSLPFNGRLYGLIVRGAQTDLAHITNAERYLAHKTGVTL